MSKAEIDILCFIKTKIDPGFPNAPFKINGYQYSHIRRDSNSKGGGKFYSFGRVLSQNDLPTLKLKQPKYA